MKTCKTCKQTKELADYHKRHNSTDGLEPSCKDCRNKKKRDAKLTNGKKQCTKCKKFKELTDFSLKFGDKSGHNSQCKQCASLYQKNRKAALAKPKRPHKEGQKQCAGCNQMKDYSAFPRSRSSIDGYVHKCKACYTTTKKANMEINYAKFYHPVDFE